MAALSTIALIGGLALSAGAQIKSGIDQKNAAKKADAQAEQERQKLLADQQTADAKAKTNDERARMAGDLQRRRAAAAGGRASTLLTGAYGLTDTAPTQRKTLLGM